MTELPRPHPHYSMLSSAHHNVQNRPFPGSSLSWAPQRGLGAVSGNMRGLAWHRQKNYKVEKNKANSTDRKRHLSVGWVMVVCGKKAVGGEDDGKWQLGVSRRWWAVVNSRYQVRIGCYQTFKAESNWLLLQQGWRDGIVKTTRLCHHFVRFVQSPCATSPKGCPSMNPRRTSAVFAAEGFFLGFSSFS